MQRQSYRFPRFGPGIKYQGSGHGVSFYQSVVIRVRTLDAGMIEVINE